MKLSLIFFACVLLVISYLAGYSRGYSAAVKDVSVQIQRVGDACVVDLNNLRDYCTGKINEIGALKRR